MSPFWHFLKYLYDNVIPSNNSWSCLYLPQQSGTNGQPCYFWITICTWVIRQSLPSAQLKKKLETNWPFFEPGSPGHHITKLRLYYRAIFNGLRLGSLLILIAQGLFLQISQNCFFNTSKYDDRWLIWKIRHYFCIRRVLIQHFTW